MNALVLGGGGPVGAAWTAALAHGLVSAGLPLTGSDVVLGTSAGSLVGAWLTMRPGELATVPDRMRQRAARHAGNARSGHGDRSLMARALAKTEPVVSIAQAALKAVPPVSAEEARAMWQADLPDGPWPPSLRVVSVNGGTGLARVWSAADGVPLAVAVASSTAAPGVAPPVALGDEFWVDGGLRSGTNADLIDEPGAVLVVTTLPSADLAREEADLVERGHRVRIVTATPFYRAVTDLLDPGLVDAAIAAGRNQATDIAAGLGKWWQYSQ